MDEQILARQREDGNCRDSLEDTEAGKARFCQTGDMGSAVGGTLGG